MGDRYGHEGLMTALAELQGVAESLMAPQSPLAKYEAYLDYFFAPPPEWQYSVEEYETGVPPPPPQYHGHADKGGDGAHGGSHDASGVAEAIGLLTAFARGDLDL